MAFLVIENGPRAGERFELVGTLTVGRHTGCDIALDDKKVSRRHTAVIAAGDHCEAVDLGSRNGTFVNGRKAQRQVLLPGDTLQIGTTLFRYGEKPPPGQIEDRIGGYEVLELVGAGGMGKVYRARQTSMDRIVALKVLHKHLTADPAFIEQFVREAQSAGKLDHRNVIHVYDVGHEGDTYFFSMEFVEGVPLSRLLQQGPLPPRQAVDIALAVAEGLEYAHEQGIVHGDVKPHNIMISEYGVKLADLGLARSMSHPDDLRSQHPRKAWGTPKYIAPEMGRGAAPDPSSDIYSLGATLYHMLVGQAPFTGKNGQEIMKKHMHEPLTPPREVNPNVPVTVARVTEKMLAKQPFDRQRTMRQVIDDLLEARAAAALVGSRAGGEDSAAISTPARPEDWSGIDTTQQSRRSGWLYLLIALLIIVAIGGGVVAYFLLQGVMIFDL